MAHIRRMGSNGPVLIPLPEGMTRIGRSPDCEVIVRSPIVSKLHAAIECTADSCRISNSSPNGTRVNGEIIGAEQTLRHGDRIRIGHETLIFLTSDDTRLAGIDEARDSDPEDSIRHTVAQPGSNIPTRPRSRQATPDPLSERIRERISFREQSVASLATTDSVRKLAQILRFCESVRESGVRTMPFSGLCELFPQATQVVVAEVAEMVPDDSWKATIQVVAAFTKDGSERPVSCDDVIQRCARNHECLLLSDQWRETPSDKPKLSRMGRVSVLCVPMMTRNGNCHGVIQLIAGRSGSEFTRSDLERLAVLAQVFSAVMPFRTG